MKVVHFHRKKRPNANHSIEGLYANVRNELEGRVDIEYVECPYYSNGLFRRLYNCIYAALRQKDVNHITGDVNYLNLFFKKRKNILTILDCGLLERLRGIKHTIAKFLWYTIPISRAKYVVAISQATKDEILKYVKCDPEKIKVIYVSVSPLYKRVDKDFNKSKPVLLHVGAAENKNLIGHIRAISGLNCKLIIVGKIDEGKLKELQDNNIEYENYIDISDEELVEKYNNCDILLFASTYEGFGMPIVEANIVGRPVITSNILSMPEVAGDAALLVNPYDIDEIRDAIIKIINDDKFRNELIENGYRNANSFSVEQISAQYLELYSLINS